LHTQRPVALTCALARSVNNIIVCCCFADHDKDRAAVALVEVQNKRTEYEEALEKKQKARDEANERRQTAKRKREEEKAAKDEFKRNSKFKPDDDDFRAALISYSRQCPILSLHSNSLYVCGVTVKAYWPAGRSH
jgi:hypothetical protein